MPVNVTVPNGDVVRSTDLAASVVADIAKANETTWVHVTELPLAGDGMVALGLYLACCEKAGVKPELPVTMETLRDSLLDIPDHVASEPVEYEGGLPDPLDVASSPSTT